jgi:hypothetical protein
MAAVSGAIVSFSHAQVPTPADVMSGATAIVSKLEEQGACDISLHGEPRLDELTKRWLVAYSGVGPACDDMGAELQRAGVPLDIAFFRQPNADELTPLINKMKASVRRGFDCRIVFYGEPRFYADSNLWTVRYYASGYQCEDAAEELERQGRELRVSFQRVR